MKGYAFDIFCWEPTYGVKLDKMYPYARNAGYGNIYSKAKWKIMSNYVS